MTTKIKWRLGKLPDPLEVADLVRQGILTKDEAREILFTQETQEDRDKQSLQEEIKFLRQLVEKLSSRTEIVNQIRYIEKPYQRYDWYEPYKFYCSNDVNSTTGYTTMTTGTNSINLLASNSGSSSDTLSYSVTSGAGPGFTAIKTF